MSETLVVIEWERLAKWNDVFEKKDEKEDYGLYQITGYHPVFGDDSLLYIGIAQEQTFSKRFSQHKNWLNEEYGIEVYVGYIKSIADKENFRESAWEVILKDAEALLVYFHSPPYNSQHISEMPGLERNPRIINTGDYGDLYPEISYEGLKLDKKHQHPKRTN